MMASPFWGLYEDLPPPIIGAPPSPAASTSPSPLTVTTSSIKPDIAEWTSNPKLAKMMPTAIRKKGALMVPRSTHVTAPKLKSATTTPKSSDNKLLAERPADEDYKPRENALSLVSAAYTSGIHPIGVEAEEEYDPVRPNEYDRYVAERMHKQKMEREGETRRDQEQWNNEESLKPTLDLSVSGEEAFSRRAKLSGRAPSPPRALPPADDEDIDGEALDTGPAYIPSQFASASASASASSSPKASVAARMMARMGWREGAGLGREEQGMTTALVHKRTDKRIGVIVNAPPAPPAAATAKPARAPVRFPPPSEQSRVLLLKNMVGPGEVDDDLQAETASECGKYGEVIKCMIYEVVGGLVEPTEAVRIFLQFTRQESALKAFIDLNGRFFGGRSVNASFYSEERFCANDLVPNNEELEQIIKQHETQPTVLL